MNEAEKMVKLILGTRNIDTIDLLADHAAKYNNVMKIIKADLAVNLLSDSEVIRHLAHLAQNGAPEQEEYDDIYPLTIIQDRYNGAYSGGKWTAFNLYREDIPPQVGAGDIEDFDFDHDKYPYGVGSTPDLAYRDLQKKLKEKV